VSSVICTHVSGVRSDSLAPVAKMRLSSYVVTVDSSLRTAMAKPRADLDRPSISKVTLMALHGLLGRQAA